MKELTSLLDPELGKVVVNMLIELRKLINKTTNHCNKDFEAIKMNQSKIDNSIAKTKTNLEAMDR